MELFNPNFVVYFIYLLIFTLMIFITGGIVSRILYVGNSVHVRVFMNLTVGYLFWILLTALYFTKGNTVFLIIPIGFIFYRIIFKVSIPRINYPLKEIVKDSVVLLKEMWFLVGIFVLFAVKHVYSNGYIESDYLFFGNVSYSMKQSGMEGVNFGMFSPYIVHPYHYGDMWLTSLITEIFKTNYYWTNIFLSIPFLLFLVYSGTLALFKEIGNRFFEGIKLNYGFLLSCLIIVIGGLDYLFIREYMAGTIALIQIPKTAVIYIIYLLAFLFLLKNKTRNAFFVILMSVGLYTQTIFYVLPGVGILICILIFKNYKTGLKYLFYYLAIVFTLIFFYYLNSKVASGESVVSFDPSKIFQGLKTFPIQLFKKSIRFVIIYLPFLALFLISIRGNKELSMYRRLKGSRLFIIVFTFLLSGYFFSLFFSRALFIVNQDYAQVLYNGYLPLMAILSMSAIFFAAYDMNIRRNNYYPLKIFLFVVILSGLALQHHRDPRYWGHLKKFEVDKQFYHELAENLEDDDKIGTFQNFEPPTEVYWFQYNYQLYPNLRRISYFRNNGVYYPECLNVYEMDTTKSEHRKYYYKKAPIIKFIDSLNTGAKNVTPAEAQYLFIKKYEFDYVILPENIKTPDNIKPMIIDSIVREDGLRVYELNTKKFMHYKS